jgi:phosphotransferase system HPr (HPr) family protein
VSTASATVTIENELGLHAKPAMAFTTMAARYACDVTVTRIDEGRSVDGKSMMAMLTLMLTRGTEIRIDAAGDDAGPAAEALAALVRSRFGLE